jgi:hypothetical protein
MRKDLQFLGDEEVLYAVTLVTGKHLKELGLENSNSANAAIHIHIVDNKMQVGSGNEYELKWFVGTRLSIGNELVKNAIENPKYKTIIAMVKILWESTF